MKKALFTASVALLALTSCTNNANDGDASTDTTNFDRLPPETAAPYGDTSREVSNEGTRTDLRMRTDVDSMSNSNRPADSTGGTNYSGKGRGTGGRNQGNSGRSGSDQ